MNQTHLARWLALLAALAALLPAAQLRAHEASSSAAQQIEARAARWLEQAAPGDTATFLIGLHDDGTQALAERAGALASKQERRARVQALLAARAGRNGAALRAFAQAGGLGGELGAITVFQSFNGFSVRATRRGVEALRGWGRVASIELERQNQLDTVTPSARRAAPAQTGAVEWNIAKIGADRVHSELGITGAGVVVGGLDTGVRASHTALSANYKCAGTGHSACWKDAVGGQAGPYDDNGHGTHTLGTAVGAGGIGVAPGASWIACKAYNFLGSALDTDILECFDWFLAPGGSSANAPDVVNNSWSSLLGFSPAYQQALASWANAGILAVFSNGNNGPLCGTVGSPASFASVLSTGATDSSDVIASSSSRGPALFGGVKPDLSAPGVDIRSASFAGDTSYLALSGTSMAAPHTSGLAALLLDANPGLSNQQIAANLKGNALGIAAANLCGSSGVPNNVYGWGRIRAYEAVQAALAAPSAQTFAQRLGAQP
ncbi:MAG TPA: S8 family serine peptidase [Roseiflexaceae bacterium]|nr:S8 family serine peptidase [Roseiflexaceae bacterium]